MLLEGSIADAKSKLVKAPRPWAVATGPATVFVLTAARLGWTVHSATTVTTDDGTKLMLHLDPPAVVKEECKLSVQRWRWRNVQLKFPTLCLGNLGVGADMTGIWSLLRSKEQSGKWNHQFKGALKSALAGRQYTQARCYAAGFATHKACLVCLYHLLPQTWNGGMDDLGASATRDVT